MPEIQNYFTEIGRTVEKMAADSQSSFFGGNFGPENTRFDFTGEPVVLHMAFTEKTVIKLCSVSGLIKNMGSAATGIVFDASLLPGCFLTGTYCKNVSDEKEEDFNFCQIDKYTLYRNPEFTGKIEVDAHNLRFTVEGTRGKASLSLERREFSTLFDKAVERAKALREEIQKPSRQGLRL